MIKIILTLTGFLLITLANAQPERRFDYQLNPYGNYMVTPIFDTTEMEGQHGLCQFLDQAYVDSIWFSLIKSSIPDEKLQLINLGSAVVFYFNTKGEVLNAWFLVHEKDKDLITEDELYDIYIKLKQLRLDTTKIVILDAQNQPMKLTKGYALISGSLQPVEYRKIHRK
jgi:hypothetical protein